MNTTIELTTEHIALGAALKLSGCVDSGGEAKHLIQGGFVQVNGETETRRAKKIRAGDSITLDTDPPIRIDVT